MKYRKIKYYLKNIILDALPTSIFQRNRDAILRDLGRRELEEIRARASYYNKLKGPFALPQSASRIDRISLSKSFYYYDLKEHARYFPPSFRLNYRFGDVTTVPDVPSFVKSRPIHRENANSILINLDKLRHFIFVDDPIPFEDKRPLAVWRGGEHNPKRVALMHGYRGHRLCDVGYTHVKPGDSRHSPFLSPAEQLAYRYVLSIEGNDVASNLKWILASNSLCLMPAPVYETWFMEGRLVPDQHYVQVADDFDDLEDKILYYEAHPAEAKEIIGNANRHARQFLDAEREQAMSLLVMYRYFVATRQIEADRSLEQLLVS